MKRQIALLGGQLVPVYLGIRDRAPDIVHLVYSEELRDRVQILESLLTSVKFFKHEVDPYNFQDISETVEALVLNIEDAQWELNLTGGTKVMTLASHNIFKDLGLEAFYLDQKNRFYFFQKKAFVEVKSEIKITTFLKLSGHTSVNKSKIGDYDRDEFILAMRVLDLMNDDSFEGIYKKLSFNLKDVNISSFSKKEEDLFIEWKRPNLKIKTKSFEEEFNHDNAFKICFTGLWWELVVADCVRKWSEKKEMLVGVELLTNSTDKFSKNEIDIILNTGHKMIFIECKSGSVKQEDVNKMKVVKRLYGGISSRSILVCRKLPRKDLLEKCSDLGIDVFALQKEQYKRNSKRYIGLSAISSLNNRLTKLLASPEI